MQNSDATEDTRREERQREFLLRVEQVTSIKIASGDEPLVARSGLLLTYEIAKALELPNGIDKELPRLGSGRGYKPSQFVMLLV